MEIVMKCRDDLNMAAQNHVAASHVYEEVHEPKLEDHRCPRPRLHQWRHQIDVDPVVDAAAWAKAAEWARKELRDRKWRVLWRLREGLRLIAPFVNSPPEQYTVQL
uniref:Uncharacterized protein n=1 Tax=Cannabis sativa TaxID=3483 RepID=A0A803NXA1_CANSA